MVEKKLQRRGTQSARLLSPDVARGLALLGIAMANIPAAWVSYELIDDGTKLGGVQPGAEGIQLALDKMTMVFGAMFVHVRGLPMFSTLLGFGIGLISMSLARRGFPRSEAWKVLIRRYGFLALFGVVHAVFLFYGDIMMMYGLMGIVLTLMIGFSNKGLAWVAGILYWLGTLGMASTFIGTFFVEDLDTKFTTVEPNPDTYLGWLGLGVISAAMHIPLTIAAGFSLFPVIIIGFIFARSGVLHEPDKHQKTLWAWTITAGVIILFIGLPWGLAEIGVLNPQWAGRLSLLNQTFGYLTGPGIVSFTALVLRGAQRRYEQTGTVPALLRAPVALGKRSMSGYLVQSIILFILMPQFTLGLFVDAGAFWLAIVGLGTWVITLVLASVLEAAGLPGPFEWLHRRLSYGRDGLHQRWIPPKQMQVLPLGHTHSSAWPTHPVRHPYNPQHPQSPQEKS
ncbi:DUF418 domain-containing protein [Corynebacterium cystitidis]|uniref:DUF418 domain-containing protein n=1 Tax=Corynebacterium cystitidis TaxID=35757 RepID=UPI00211F0D5E|nr:DUF418 domain-containing protein [Corynebacterium cystitidis]